MEEIYENVFRMWKLLTEIEAKANELGTKEQQKIVEHIADVFYELFKFDIYYMEMAEKEASEKLCEICGKKLVHKNDVGIFDVCPDCGR